MSTATDDPFDAITGADTNPPAGEDTRPEAGEGGGEQAPEPTSEPSEPEPSAPQGGEAEAPAAAPEQPGGATEPEAGEPEPAADASTPQTPAPSDGLPQGVRRDLAKLRQQKRELQEQLAAAQAFQPGQPAQHGAPQPQAPAMPQLKVKTVVDPESGEEYVDPQALAQFNAQQQAAQQGNPQQVAAQAIHRARLQFVAQDPDTRGPATQRVDEAVQVLDALTDHAVRAGGGYVPQSLDEWEASVATTSGWDQFRQMFPEIRDPKRLAHAVAASRMGDVQSLRNYMDDYMTLMWPDLGPKDPPPEVAPPTGDGTVSASEEVKPSAARLSTGRPRSMATKGEPSPADEGLQSEMKALEKDIDADPMGIDPDAEKKHQRLAEIRKKLNLG